MAYNVQHVIDIAINEIGYLEKETYDQLDEKTANAGDANYTMYQRDLAEINYFNSSKKGVAWCAVFLAWCFVQAFGKTAALKLLCQPRSSNAGAGCTSAANYFKKNNQFVTENPAVGDVIFFYSSDGTEISHIGLVYKVDKKYVYTVEGNTTKKGIGVPENGGAVNKQKYKLTTERIAGYGRPDYGVADETQVENNTTEDTIIVDENLIPAWVHGTTSGAVNFRKTPNKKSNRVSGMKEIKEGEQVGIKTTDGTWAAVEYRGFRGYVMMEFLTYDNPATDEEEVKQEDQPQTDENVSNTEIEQLTHVVVKGETLWGLSKKYLGAGYKYKEIMKASGLKNSIIYPGMVLRIPEA